MLKHVVQLTGLTALAVALSVGSVAQAAPVASVLTGDEMAFAFAAPVAADGVQVLSQGEMQTTEGAVFPLALLSGVLAGSAISAWAYHMISIYKTGQLGTSEGAAWAAGAGAIGGLHGGGLVAYAGLTGGEAVAMGLNGLAVSSALNFINPAYAASSNNTTATKPSTPTRPNTPATTSTTPSTRPTTSVTTSTRPTTSVTSSSSINYQTPVIVNNNDNRFVIQSTQNQLNQNYANIVNEDRFIRTVTQLNDCGGRCLTIYGR